MAAPKGSRNNVLAGVFVVLAIVLFVLVIIVMSSLGDAFTKQSKYTVRFSIADGVEGLDKGAQVKIGGQRVGKVLEIETRDNSVTGEPEWVDVQVRIPAKYKLYSDADVVLVRPLLGTGSTINIAALTGVEPLDEREQGPARRLLPGDTIYGRLGPPGFLAPSDYAKFRAVLTRVDRITADVQPRVSSIMDNADAAVLNVRKVSEDLNTRWPQWSGRASDVIERIDRASLEFDAIVASVRTTATAVEEGVNRARELVERARAMIDENRASIDEVIRNVRALSERASGEWSAKITAVIDDARVTLESVKQTAQDAQDLVARNSPQLDDLVANAAIASQQLKLTTVEIRASPWRLLYQPSKRELENELLYNTVRQYSEAVTELKGASAALDALTKRKGAGVGGAAVDQQAIDAMQARLQRAFGEYQKREREFLDRWVREGR